MFRNLARLLALTPRPAGSPPAQLDVFKIHPLQLSRWLDEAWVNTATVPAFGGSTPAGGPPQFLGDPAIITTLDLPSPSAPAGQEIVPSGIDLTAPDVFTNRLVGPTLVPALIWDHLFYAYVIESTGVFEVMAEVVRRLLVGETLNTLSPDGVRWLRATEELFFRDPPLFSISSVVSDVRPDYRVNRRNTMWRMLGTDLPHPIPDRWRGSSGGGEAAWKIDTGTGVNTGFLEKWNELLRQVWLGFENARNANGPNATDAEYIAFLARAIKDMLNMRRRGGQLAREEFVHVATMSWFHLTLEFDSPIVHDLSADATSPADRLARVAQRVGMQPAARSRELFELADLVSGLLRAIELGIFDTGTQAETLYLPLPTGTNQLLIQDMNRVIDLWQSATGENLKDRRVSVIGGTLSAQPLRIPTPGPAPQVAASNGHG